MKKRIISISLAITIVAVMVPTLLTNAFAEDVDIYDDVSYGIYATSQHVYLDGKMDDAYLGSTKIISAPSDIDWYAYPVATLDGFYLFARVEDVTMNNINDEDAKTGDGIAISLDWTPYGYAHTDVYGEDYVNSFASQVGTVFADYTGKLAASGDFEYVVNNGGRVVYSKSPNPDWDEVDESTRYIGYNIEIFVPYTDYMKTVIDTQSESYHFGLGIQVGNDEAYDETDNGENYSNDFEDLTKVKLHYADDMPIGVGSNYAANVESEIVLDGKNTKGEYDDAQVVHVNKGGMGDADNKNIFRVICDGNYLSVLMETTDYTVSSGDVMALYYARYGEGDSLVGNSIERTRGFVDDGEIENGWISASGNDMGWAIEARFELSVKEKKLYEEGKLLYGISVVFRDESASGHVSCKSDVAELADVFHAEGIADYTGLYRRFTASADMNNAPKLKGANVSLAESIALKFYATLGRADLGAKLKITMNNKTYYIGPQKTATAGEYKFVLEDIAPQYMGDLMNAELVIDGEAVTGVYDYSVLKNVTSGDVLNETTGQLIYDLLAYGTAAQGFTGYKTDTPINEGYEELTNAGKTIIENDDRTYTDALTYAKFTAAGVYHSHANSLYVKFDFEDVVDTVTITIDGEPAVIEQFSETEYIAYSDEINVVDFDKIYTFELTITYEEPVVDGETEEETVTVTETQTLTYSINAYAAMKCGSDNAETSNLANALYAYGVSAQTYAESLNNVE